MVLTGIVARDILNLDIPSWIPTVLGVLGLAALGVYNYQHKTFKKFALMLSVYLLIFVVLVVLQLSTTP